MACSNTCTRLFAIRPRVSSMFQYSSKSAAARYCSSSRLTRHSSSSRLRLSELAVKEHDSFQVSSAPTKTTWPDQIAACNSSSNRACSNTGPRLTSEVTFVASIGGRAVLALFAVVTGARSSTLMPVHRESLAELSCAHPRAHP